jgi:hypothetical protein
MTASIGRRGLLALVLGLATIITGPAATKAQPLPAYDAKAGMLAIGKDPERPDAEIFHMDYILKDGKWVYVVDDENEIHQFDIDRQ